MVARGQVITSLKDKEKETKEVVEPKNESKIKQSTEPKSRMDPEPEKKEKKIAISVSKAKSDTKPGRLAPPSGWRNPNQMIGGGTEQSTTQTQSAQNVINLLDFDDEMETAASKPTVEHKSQTRTEHPNIINITQSNTTPNVDLLDLDFDDNTSNMPNSAGIIQAQPAGDPIHRYKTTTNAKSEIAKVAYHPDDLFGDDDDHNNNHNNSKSNGSNIKNHP